MATIDWITSGDIESSGGQLDRILQSGVFAPQGSTSPLFESAVVHAVILAADLLRKAEKYATRVDFAHHLPDPRDPGIADVTDLLVVIRNAVCHVSSGLHMVDHKRKVKATFVVGFGSGHVASINGVDMISEFTDDIAFFFGPTRMYLRRHLVAGASEAFRRLRPHLATRARSGPVDPGGPSP